MSFGFSVGDIVAVGSLIYDITKSLQDMGGARSEYQELVRELETLKKALNHLDTLQRTCEPHATLDSIKYAALSCRQPLEEFLNKIQKYKQSLDVWAKSSTLKSAADKLKWTFGHKEEVKKIQSYLNLHIGVINMLLAEHGLAKMTIASDKADAENLYIRERLQNTRALIHGIQDSLLSQRTVVRNVHSMLSELFQMVTGEFKTSWQSLSEMVARVCVSTQQIYGIVLEIKGSISTVDTRWTFFQAPFVVEDALGFKFPVPSEYSVDMLENIIEYRFRKGEGSRDVKAGNYELFKTKHICQVLSADIRVLPGTEITMAIIISSPILNDEACPISRCGSTRTTIAPAGGRVCCLCNTWFSEARKKRTAIEGLFDIIDQLQAEAEQSSSSQQKSNRPELLSTSTLKTTDVENFKNVRFVREDEPVEDETFSDEQSSYTMDSVLLPDFADSGGTENLPSLETVPTDQPSFSVLNGLGQQVFIRDALEYLDEIKSHYSHSPEVYIQFLKVMQTFKDEKLDTPGVIKLVIALFSDAPELSFKFEKFCPVGYRISDFLDANTDATMANSATHTNAAKSTRKRKSPRLLDNPDNKGSSSVVTRPTKRPKPLPNVSSKPKQIATSIARRSPKRAPRK